MDYILEILPLLLYSLKNTLLVFIIALIGSLPLGIIIALGRLSKIQFINKTFQFYIYVMRGTPLLLQIIFIYFGLPALGIIFDRFTAVIIAFVLNYAAYYGEIFRGGILSIDEGQYQASQVLGISKFDTFFKIIFPQVVKRVLPSIANEVITLVKDTSLIYAVGLNEILKTTKSISNRDATLIPFVLTAIIYLVLTSIFTKLLERVEKKYAYYK